MTGGKAIPVAGSRGPRLSDSLGLAPPVAAEPQDEAPVTVDSQALLQGRGSVAISHRGVVYRLQATRMGKLILTK